ncbi:MAG: putative RNA-binding protein with PUA-like domain [Glaciecola sp.]|jgi:predicted RNA-binding protein with PUA-like domain
MKQYWLFKTEPDAFSINDLANRPNKREGWDGVRNYQARNFMRDAMKVGDMAFIYHSSCKNIGIAGLAKVSQIGLTDQTQFDPESHYFDPKSMPEKPRWQMVELEHVETFNNILPLATIKQMPNIVELGLVKKGSRLSIMPVEEQEFEILLNEARNN